MTDHNDVARVAGVSGIDADYEEPVDLVEFDFRRRPDPIAPRVPPDPGRGPSDRGDRRTRAIAQVPAGAAAVAAAAAGRRPRRPSRRASTSARTASSPS